jgi:uncharacterized protein DUF1194
MTRASLAALILGALLAASPAQADSVDILLVLAADVSRSIDNGEFELQRKGYAAALADPRVLKAIASGPHQAIDLAYIEWSDAPEQQVVVDWTRIGNGEDAAAVAATILKATRSFGSRTAIGSAIDFSMQRLMAAKDSADKRIIDVSGDGTDNSGGPVSEARDRAVAVGVTINGLAIINTDAGPGFIMHTQPPGGLPEYYRQNVIGGPGAFLLQVENFGTFTEAMVRKLVSEIAEIPGGGQGAILAETAEKPRQPAN